MDQTSRTRTDKPVTSISQTPAAGTWAPVHIGIDIGSIAVKLAVIDGDGILKEHEYQRHLGQPANVAYDLLEAVTSRYDENQIAGLAVTGTAGRFVCELIDAKFINELSCQAAAVRDLAPSARTIVEMGGQDSKLILLSADPEDLSGIDDFAMNTACAAGTGSFLDQQASRMNMNISEFAEMSLKCKAPPRVAGRCSVFAKSDMIHLQQQATALHDIIGGLCFGLARNLKSNLGRGKDMVKPIAFCGGVAWNAGVVRALREVLEAEGEGEFIVPEHHALTGAIGAAMITRREWDRKTCVEVNLFPLREYLASQKTIGHRLGQLKRPEKGYPDMDTHAEEIFASLKEGEKIPAYLGIDVGSISTNVVVVDDELHVLAKAYLMTAGKPLEAVRKGLAMVGVDGLTEKVDIKGVATTGSGRYLTGDFVGADTVVNEITAQATAAALIDPEVDTIFEIGGQDSKYISLEGGVVVDFEMNHACAAGTGSFLEEQAERLGINIKKEFSDLALKSENPIRLGERCTVFMESDLLNYQQQGAATEDLVGGLCYSIVANYLNRVVGRRRIGNRIFFQGGTAFNKGVVAAFEAVTGKQIAVPPHHEVTGAIGVASLARRYVMDNNITESTFRGFDISNRKYEIRSFECQKCPNNCEIKEVTIEGSDDPLFYGSRCDIYNVKKDADKGSNTPDLFRERQQLLEKYGRARRKPRGDRKTVGIPMMLSSYQMLPFWGTLFDELGFDPIMSAPSTKKLIRRGVEVVASQPCFPVKVAHGHVLDLLEKGVDYLWMPSLVSMEREEADINNQLCPYVQTIPYQVKMAIDMDKYDTKFLSPFLRFQDGWAEVARCLQGLCSDLGVTKSALIAALDMARKAQRKFESDCCRRGKEVLDGLKEGDEAMVLVSRPYNGCDTGVSLDIPGKLHKLGVLIIPVDFLDMTGVSSAARLQANDGMYWKYGQKIMKAARIIRNDPRLHAIYLTNFSCGPDSFIGTFFKDIMTPKPFLMLEIDEHSADAGVVTRIEAYLESLRNSKNILLEPIDEEALKTPKFDCSERKVFIPWMGDHSYALASAFKASGQPAEILPLADQESLEIGRRYTTGKECLPCIVTTGDMVKRTRCADFDPEKAAFFMPGGSGPCRFGQYNCLQRQVLAEIGMSNVPVISPSQDKGFYDDFKQFQQDPTRLAWNGIAGIDVLIKALLATRPFEITTGQTDETYNGCVRALCEAIEKNASESDLVNVMRNSADLFGKIKVDHTVEKPHIGLVGEI